MLHLRRSRHVAATIGVGLSIALAMTACSGGGSDSEGSQDGSIEVWAHTGQSAESEALQALVKKFNSSQEDVTANLTLIPEADYTSTIQATSADELPDVMEMDAPTMASFAYDRKLVPLDDVLSADTLDNRIEGVSESGTYNDQTYAVGMFDVGLGLWGNKALLEKAGIKDIPTTAEEAWTVDEFEENLAKLAKTSASGKAIDLGEANGFAAEWGTFTTTPDVWSAGGTLIKDGKAEGVINSQENVDALKQWASWKEYADPNTSGTAFPEGQTALTWTGNWMYPTFSEALGEDLVLMPLPDFGNGTKAGHGSWQWGVTPAAEGNTEAAGSFLDFLMTDESIAAMVEANAAVPGSTTALEQSELYGPDKPLEMFANNLASACSSEDVTEECIAVARPVTPGYPTVTSSFGSALLAIWGGADVKEELDAAARAIDSDFSDNNGYEDE
ncbi:ABC transporter substrate-binding protein [Arthrobacter roseus]|uniref:ABC transporter substrate-binding protein n=1 Tax=Arthrobacter roseus TaxID=136274 RepID=UPI001963CB9D|nr:sugar ABC transporter substrate-binding protein [Arthrobacter roseus]MBM7846911.1 multiple sugar transport system substrate-binding protein [Arthrobacter roseus]